MKKRVFISYALEDSFAKDFLIGQMKSRGNMIDLVDMPPKGSFDEHLKIDCRRRLKQCSGVIALISKSTMRSNGARWEMWCANDVGLPMIGVHINTDEKNLVPPELKGKQVIDWTWEKIYSFLTSL